MFFSGFAQRCNQVPQVAISPRLVSALLHIDRTHEAILPRVLHLPPVTAQGCAFDYPRLFPAPCWKDNTLIEIPGPVHNVLDCPTNIEHYATVPLDPGIQRSKAVPESVGRVLNLIAAKPIKIN